MFPLTIYLVRGNYFMIKCEIDGKEFKNGGVMAKYLKKQYSLTYREYYHKYILKTNEIPKCKCGCKEELPWTHIGYRDYKGNHGTILRLKTNNPWGHNPEAIKKSAETRRRQFANGERQIWCKGLTTNTDERVKRLGENVSKAYTDERKKKTSDLMSQNRKNGIIPTLHGPNHSQWIDGRSNISVLVYNDVRLYKEWKYPILVRDGFKCVECKRGGGKLHIHHDKEYMNEIIKDHLVETTSEMLKDFKIKRMIADAVVDYHIQNKVSGITLCGDCHEKYHPSLNFD